MPASLAFRCGLAVLSVAGPAFVSDFRAADADEQAERVARRAQATDLGTFADRLLILAPGGPIVLQTNAFIDGQTQQEVREKIIDDVLKQADTDRDGKSTWNEALGNPRFLYTGPFRSGGNLQEREQVNKSIIRQFDVNSDGVLDRAEAQTILNQYGGRGVAFGGGFRGVNGGSPGDLKPLLDTDGDGKLSAAEIAAAPERLKSRDANDNDLLEALEINPAAASPATFTSPRGEQLYPALMPLGLGANFQSIHQALLSRYGVNDKLVAEGMPLFPRLLDALDRNANGQLEQDEVAGFNTMRPHVAITVAFKSANFVPPEHDASGIGVNFLAPEFENRDVVNQMQDTLALMLPGVRLTIAAPPSQRQPQTNFRATAEGQLAMYDTDKNGYLEKKELESSPNAQYLLQEFDRWDEDGDGKVYAKEIEADFERRITPQKAQINLSAQDNGTGLFAALDQSGDSRLGLREMRIAAEQLKKLDTDNDGMLAGQEMPTEIQVTLGQGGLSRGGFGAQLIPAANNRSRPVGVKWFTSMDRNGDGDITLREFLGTPEKFRDLDTNADGFIEPAEAEKAK